MYSRYVVGVDGSPPSRAAIEWTAERANREGTPVLLAHVEEPEGGMMGRDFAAGALKAGEGLLADAAAGLTGRGFDVATTLLNGPVSWALAEVAAPSDLLVVGTHKTGFLHGRVLGSRSVQIAAAAHCSVAVIPDGDLRFRRGVVVGLDSGEDADDVAQTAAAEAEKRGEDLSIIRALPERAEAAHLVALLEGLRTTFPGLVVRSRESRRQPAEALLDASRDKALLVIGPGDAERSPIGSVLHDVLLNLNAPALIARGVRAAAR
jgi:nucleotide-binding universal stress UspA family protein